jgi:molybdopterin converting factor small subunit
MRIHVVLLGRAGELAGVSNVTLDLPENSKLIDLIRALGERLNPALAKRYFEGHYIYVVHVNEVAVDDPNYILHDGDRVVLVTPEMGG